MKKIFGNFHVSSTDFEKFNSGLNESINKLQDDYQEVEIQYNTNTFPNGQILYSALLIGRKESVNEFPIEVNK